MSNQNPNCPQLSMNNQLLLTVLKTMDDLNAFLKENHTWLEDKKFGQICLRYQFPEKSLTVIVDQYYIDPAYRDIYYHHLSRLHFDWPRYCRRLFLFYGAHTKEEFLNIDDDSLQKRLKDDFLGTLVVRPSYSLDSLPNTLGMTLLNPDKMVLLEKLEKSADDASRNHDGKSKSHDDKSWKLTENEKGEAVFTYKSGERWKFAVDADGNRETTFLRYLKKREYQAHLLGNTYRVDAFPFSGQDGIVLTCAENAIALLCEYASRASSLCAKILPSDIQEILKSRYPERILPSHGLSTEDISYILRKLGFSPRIYSRQSDDRARGPELYDAGHFGSAREPQKNHMPFRLPENATETLALLSEEMEQEAERLNSPAPADSPDASGTISDVKQEIKEAADSGQYERAAILKGEMQRIERSRNTKSELKRRLESCKDARDDAVRGERYEEAAKWRDEIEELEEQLSEYWHKQHEPDYRRCFHYYIESGIPLLMIAKPISSNADANNHATLVIGHAKRQKPLEDCRLYDIGSLYIMDTAEFYEQYILQDDNQIPYCVENIEQLTEEGNYRLSEYIVPFPSHVFLAAADAVTICDSFITQMSKKALREPLKKLKAIAEKLLSKAGRDELISVEECQSALNSLEISQDNPIVVRYFLVDSAEYKRHRILTGGDSLGDVLLYSSVPMPKFIWLAEISTYRFYQDGYAFGEIALDATASKLSALDSVLLFRTVQQVAFRRPDQTYGDLIQMLKNQMPEKNNIDIRSIFQIFSNFD